VKNSGRQIVSYFLPGTFCNGEGSVNLVYSVLTPFSLTMVSLLLSRKVMVLTRSHRPETAKKPSYKNLNHQLTKTLSHHKFPYKLTYPKLLGQDRGGQRGQTEGSGDNGQRDRGVR